jgi:hypothetical protein
MHDVEYLQKLYQSKELQDIEYALCADEKTGAYYWLTHWARTLDVHDSENPIKSFPDKEYLKIIVDKWLTEPLLLLPKSRQMMFSWLIIALYLWDSQFHVGRLTFFQSKKEEDADDLIKRAKFIWDNEPMFLKRYRIGDSYQELLCNPQNKGNHTYCRMIFPDIYSEIRGIPQGGDVIRMHTASGIFSDEMAFQPEASEAYAAAKPTISSKGRFTGVSTAEDNSFFEDLIFDKIEMT